MAEVGAIGSALTAPPVNISASTTRPVANDKPKFDDAALKDVVNADEKKKAESKEENLKDVVAVSTDGDTVQVSEDGREKLNDEQLGRVVLKEGDESAVVKEEEDIKLSDEAKGIAVNDDKAKKAAAEREAIAKEDEERKERISELNADIEKAAEEKKAERSEKLIEDKNEGEEESKPEITSFAGYTESQLEQMYLKGDITMQDYNNEISQRQEALEAMEEEDNEFSKEMNAEISQAAQVSRGTEAIENAFDENANDNISAQDRIQFINAAEQMARMEQ